MLLPNHQDAEVTSHAIQPQGTSSLPVHHISSLVVESKHITNQQNIATLNDFDKTFSGLSKVKKIERCALTFMKALLNTDQRFLNLLEVFQFLAAIRIFIIFSFPLAIIIIKISGFSKLKNL